MKYRIFVCFFIFSLLRVESYVLSPRNAAYCAYLSNRIFCYGGSVGDVHYDSSIHSLDINNQPAGTSVNDLLNQWDNISENNSQIVTEFRYDSEFVPLPDGVSMFLEGGSNDNSYPIANKTVTYNTQTNTWHALPEYNEPLNRGLRQISVGSAVYMPNLNCIGFYGGREFHAIWNSSYITATGQALSGLQYNYSSEHDKNLLLVESYVGFYYMTLFNLSNYAWSVPSQTNSSPFLGIYQTATFHPRTGKVYFLGGFYHDNNGNNIPVPLSFSLTYDTILASWDNKTLNASNGVPHPRYLHTSTLLTTTNEDIVVYGGTDTDLGQKPLPLEDYLYTLNLVTFSWTSFNPVAPAGVSGPRFYHSAILVNDTSLFIMLGKLQDQGASNDILVLDVRNASSLVFSSTFPLSDNIQSSVSSTSSNQLSNGVIAGIAVGVVIAVVVAIAVTLFLCYIRRKKRRDAAAAVNKRQQELEVDWDQIEGEFREISPTPFMKLSEESKSPTSTLDGTATTAATVQVPFSPVDHQKIRASMYSPALASDVGLSKPDVSEEAIEKSAVKENVLEYGH